LKEDRNFNLVGTELFGNIGMKQAVFRDENYLDMFFEKDN
jgi:hypothetical protein